MKTLIGKKVGMTQIFDEKGRVIPVTVIEAGPCVVAQVKSVETDGYNAIQLGFGDVKESKLNKPEKGHFAKANIAPKKHLREFRLDSVEGITVGTELTVTEFAEGDRLDIQGTTKGKGFQGVIKRHGQHRGPMGHGSMYHRRPGSMGPTSTPGRVFKGKKLPGHMGRVTVTIQNLDVVKVDSDKNVVLVKGSVPGPKGAILKLKTSVKAYEGGNEMPSIDVYNIEGKKVDSVNLSEEIFGIEPNEAVVHSVLVNFLANQRQGTQSTKTRAEVRGGGRKPWRQKGTGRARQGSIRAPQWIKGGIALGPKPRSYKYTVNKKERRLAIKSVLSSKVLENELVVVDNLNLKEIKTNAMVKALNNLKVEGKTLILLPEKNETVQKSARNIENVKTTLVNTINVYDLLKYNKLVVTLDTVKKLEEVYA